MTAIPICLMLERQAICRPFCFARVNAGKSIAARMAMIAITTRSSMSVKPFVNWDFRFDTTWFGNRRFSSVFIRESQKTSVRRPPIVMISIACDRICEGRTVERGEG